MISIHANYIHLQDFNLYQVLLFFWMVFGIKYWKKLESEYTILQKNIWYYKATRKVRIQEAQIKFLRCALGIIILYSKKEWINKIISHHPWWHSSETVTWRRLYRMFTYIYSPLIEKDICDIQNVSVKLPCVYVWLLFDVCKIKLSSKIYYL